MSETSPPYADDLEIEPDALDVAPGDDAPAAADDVDIEPEPVVTTLAPVAAQPLTEVLGADVDLPALLRFVPDVRLKAVLDDAVARLLAIEVVGQDGLIAADAAFVEVRQALAAIDAHFDEPKALANAVHKSITSKLSEWRAPGVDAVTVAGRRMATERQRLEQIAAADRRRRQEEEDRKAREERRREAEAAAAAQAPTPVVEEMRRQAETATAPPVAQASTYAPPKTAGTTVTKTWKCRLRGNPADADPNPEMALLDPVQRERAFELLRAILDGQAPIAAIDFNWSYLNNRAKADKTTFRMAGLEAYEELNTRAKGGRRA